MFWSARNHGHIAIRYVCVPWLLRWPIHLSPETPECQRHSNIKIRPINNITSTCPIDRKNHASLTLNPKIEMVKLLKKACQSQDGPETRPLPCNSQVVNAKKAFIKEIKSAPPVTKQRRRYENSLPGDMENLSVDCRKDHNTALGQSLSRARP